MNRSLDSIVLRYVGYATLALFGLVLLYLVRGTLPIFLLALLIAYAFEPLLQGLERRGYSRRAAVFFVFLIYLLFFVCMLALLAAAWEQMVALSENVPKYLDESQTLMVNMQRRIETSSLPKGIKRSILQAVVELRTNPPSIPAARLKDTVAYIFGSVSYIAVMCVVLPVITFSMMLDMNPMRTRALMIVPPHYRRDVIEMAQNINQILGRYVRGQLIVCSLFGFLCTIAFSVLGMIFGMGYPLVLGLAAGLLYLVPFVGLMTVIISASSIAYFTASAPIPCVICTIVCCVVFNLLLDYVVSPRVIGKGVGLHPLMVIFALLSGAEMGGVPGMILAVPFFASLRAVLIYLFPQLTAPITQIPPEVAAAVAGHRREPHNAAAGTQLMRAAADAESTAHGGS